MEKNNSDVVIKITNLNKEYKMFARKKDRLLETVLPKYKKINQFLLYQFMKNILNLKH